MQVDPNIEIARQLAQAIAAQADSFKEYQRIWIAGAAMLIDRLTSPAATDADRRRAQAYLELAHR